MRFRSVAAALITAALLYFFWFYFIAKHPLVFDRSYPIFLIILIALAIYIFFVIKFLKWVAKIARKNNRSVTGFVWLAVFFPVIVAIILLIIDKDDKPKLN